MGWKASTIIIHKPTQVDHVNLLQALGFANLTKIDDEPFESVINPDDDTVYVGTYKDNLLICAPDIPMQFFEDEVSHVEKTLIEHFPTSEICSIILHSVVNLWGFSVIQNGQKIRVKAGSADDGTFVDVGEPLEEEKDLLSKSTLDKKGNRIYLLEDFPNEPFNEDQVGENFVFEICSRYFGAPLDRSDELLFETPMKGYSYSNFGQSNNTQQPVEQNTSNREKPWWKFW